MDGEQSGENIYQFKTLYAQSQSQSIDFIWGVLDMVPDTDFPDVRNKSLIHSNHGSCLVVPREADRVRIYMQLGDKDVINAETGRVDKDRIGPEQLLEVSEIIKRISSI
jgi:phenol 2-monooxygenase